MSIFSKLSNFGYTEKCEGCNNKHSCMCDCCPNHKFAFGETENHHTNYYLDINFEPKFLEYEFKSNMKKR